ncbi:DUF2147 domain-containing protein [Asticcacaulis solisilvae]|uniref:DUF2147 domain-containing protein n=1 Tax=Asticcacaulis solisilvae TaxID=1217274 RepID=UPI003FD6D32E
MPGLIMMLAAAEAATPVGTWMTQERDAIVRIVACPGHASELCGRIERILDPTEADARDEHNPDPSRRSQPVLGLSILSGFTPVKAGWSGGRIYDPDDGRTHTGLDLRLDGADRLVISKPASLFILKAEVGKQVWTRVAP